jgi:plastocyanin
MHLDITKETVVIWENQDDYGHTVQSQDNAGNVIPIFNSDILLTGQTFEHKFTENGDYQYFCTLHPWRVGTISVI